MAFRKTLRNLFSEILCCTIPMFICYITGCVTRLTRWDVTSGAGTAYPSGAHEFTPDC